MLQMLEALQASLAKRNQMMLLQYQNKYGGVVNMYQSGGLRSVDSSIQNLIAQARGMRMRTDMDMKMMMQASQQSGMEQQQVMKVMTAQDRMELQRMNSEGTEK
jgi:hypothetical protein